MVEPTGSVMKLVKKAPPSAIAAGLWVKYENMYLVVQPPMTQ